MSSPAPEVWLPRGRGPRRPSLCGGRPALTRAWRTVRARSRKAGASETAAAHGRPSGSRALRPGRTRKVGRAQRPQGTVPGQHLLSPFLLLRHESHNIQVATLERAVQGTLTMFCSHHLCPVPGHFTLQRSPSPLAVIPAPGHCWSASVSGHGEMQCLCFRVRLCSLSIFQAHPRRTVGQNVIPVHG